MSATSKRIQHGFAVLVLLALTACTVNQAPTPNSQSAPLPTGTSDRSVAVLETIDDPPLTLFTILGDVRLLAQPEDAPECLELLQGGTRLIRFGRQGAYAKVMDPATGSMGWIEDRLLSPQAPLPPESIHPGQGSISETF
ncbi:MAG: hypothetical protein KKB70_01355 [Proteobacteria bacterium]|nr:hypothetical protein [Pseudomonadota bacterium]MBU1612207.1 hypothetical protein [Pseudomonadota bacterium]